MRKLLALLTAIILVACCTKPQQNTAHPQWSYDAVVYEMNVRQYTPEGTFAAAQRELPRLRELGVDVIWLMPIHPIGVLERKGSLGSYYAISDYEAVNPEFGTMQDFDNFLAEAHALGLRIILDWVGNHTSPDARWTVEKPADWYVRDSIGNFAIQYDWTDIAKLDFDNRDMRAAMVEVMRFWLDRGIDGFRFDVAGEMPIDFFREALPPLRTDYPGVYFLAEGEGERLHVDGVFDASYAWELHHIFNDVAQGKKSAGDIREYVERDAVRMPREAFRLMFTSNHDENSWAGTEFERMGDAAHVMAVLTFTLPNTQPLIYTGQEIGLERRLAFFDKDPIESWEANDFTDFYKSLTKLYHKNRALHSGERGGVAVFYQTDINGLLLFSRAACKNEVVVAANLSAEPVSFTLPFEGKRKEFFTGEKYSGETEVTLPAWQWFVFTK